MIGLQLNNNLFTTTKKKIKHIRSKIKIFKKKNILYESGRKFVMMLFYHFPICIIYIFKFTNCFCQLKNLIEVLIVRLNRMGNPAAQTMRNGRTREEGVRGGGPGKSVATPFTMLGQGTANRPGKVSVYQGGL